MPKEIAIPSSRLKQNTLLFQGIALLFVLIIITIFFCKFITFVHYPDLDSRIPEYHAGIWVLPLFCISFWYTTQYLLNNKVYHFQLHSDVLIITSRSILGKKRVFFYLEKISSISIQKEKKFVGIQYSTSTYQITTLSVQSNNEALVQYSFSPSSYELKNLKEFFKDFI